MTAPRPRTFEALIVGAFPAGLNAALVFSCTRGTALVFDLQENRNEGIKHMQTVASRGHQGSFRRQLENKSILATFGERYEGIEGEDSGGQTYNGKKLILAMILQGIMPDIPGSEKDWPETSTSVWSAMATNNVERPLASLSSSQFQSHLVQMATAFDSNIAIPSNGSISDDTPIPQAPKTPKTSRR